MRKSFTALALALAALSANAETITLPQAVCGAARICKSAGVEIRANTMYPSVAVVIGERTFYSLNGGERAADGTFDHIGPTVLYDGNDWIMLTAEFSSYRKPASGKLRAVTIWTLESGTVERP